MVHSNEFGAAARELRESWLVAWVGSVANVVALAARHSRIVLLWAGLVRDFRSLNPVVRLRLILLTIAVAIVVHVLLGQFVSPHFAPLWLAPH
jgi:hypothetical protein